jgi:hypothetical protein
MPPDRWLLVGLPALLVAAGICLSVRDVEPQPPSPPPTRGAAPPPRPPPPPTPDERDFPRGPPPPASAANVEVSGPPFPPTEAGIAGGLRSRHDEMVATCTGRMRPDQELTAVVHLTLPARGDALFRPGEVRVDVGDGDAALATCLERIVRTVEFEGPLARDLHARVQLGLWRPRATPPGPASP